MTKKDLNLIARTLKALGESGAYDFYSATGRVAIACLFAEALRATNMHFDTPKFLVAATLPDDILKVWSWRGKPENAS